MNFLKVLIAQLISWGSEEITCNVFVHIYLYSSTVTNENSLIHPIIYFFYYIYYNESVIIQSSQFPVELASAKGVGIKL